MTADASLISGAVNFRDVGGLPAAGGRTRFGVLYRSGNLARVDAAGSASLAAIGLRRVIDLRADEEVSDAPSRLAGLDVSVQRAPLFLGSVASFFERDMTLSELYRTMLDGSAERLVAAVRGILADQPVLVHCTVGKDRTGVTVALALAAAGVTQEAVVADYARTADLLPEWRNREVLERLHALHPEARHLAELASASPAPVMRELLDGLNQRFGSAAGYLRAHGMDDAELAELTRLLIHPA